MPAPTDYPNRFVIYLKPLTPAKAATPTEAAKPAVPAMINALAFINPKGEATEPDFLNNAPVEIPPDKAVAFNIVSKRNGSLLIRGIPVGWEGGCPAIVACLLWEKGNNIGDRIGVDYDSTNELPCDRLICSFSGAGVLNIRDGLSVNLDINLNKGGGRALCLTVTTGATGTGTIEFPSHQLKDVDITQPA